MWHIKRGILQKFYLKFDFFPPNLPFHNILDHIEIKVVM